VPGHPVNEGEKDGVEGRTERDEGTPDGVPIALSETLGELIVVEVVGDGRLVESEVKVSG
jgi:hypothetical protein